MDSIICHNCGGTGHMAATCSSKNKRPRFNESHSAHATCTEENNHSTNNNHHPDNDHHHNNNNDEYNDIALSCINESAYSAFTSLSGQWILDSAATSHHTGNRSLLHNMRKLTNTHTTITGNGISAYNETGDAHVWFNDQRITLSNVIYIPKFKVNLISVGKLTDHGCNVTYGATTANVYQHGKLILAASKQQGLYVVNAQHAYLTRETAPTNTTQTQRAQTNTTQIQTKPSNKVIAAAKLLHAQYGHMSYMRLYNMIKNNSVDGVNNLLKNEKQLRHTMLLLSRGECVGCVKGKMHRVPMTGKIEHDVRAAMDLWVVDVIGPISIKTIGGRRYVLMIMDVFTRHIFAFVMERKSDSAHLIINQIKQSQTQTDKKLKRMHSDGGKEIVNREVSEYIESNGTIHTITTAHTPQHNALIERMNRTIVEMTKAMLYHATAYLPLWGEAIMTAAYLLRRGLTQAHPIHTPCESWTGRKPNIANLHVFGCDVYYHIIKANRHGKLGENAARGIFVGYDYNNDTYYRVFDVQTNKIITTRDVRFNDESFTEMKRLNDKNNNDADENE